MNPYQSPSSSVAISSKLTSNMAGLAFLSVGLICALVAAITPALVVPKFEQVFIGFGAEIPLITHIVLNYHLWLWLLPIFVVVIRLSWPKSAQRPLASCLFGVTSLVLVIPLTIYAMYMPIFLLGQTT
jgi:hypothetical protein